MAIRISYARSLPAGFALLMTVATAQAADFSSPSVIQYEPGGLPTVPWSWTGAYIGGNVGSSESRSSLDNPAGRASGTGSLFGDRIIAPGGFGGLQGGYNWQMPNSNWVLGLEAALSFNDGHGSNTCLTRNSFADSANCRFSVRSFGDVVGRAGYAFGPDDRALAYVKAGGGYVGESASETNNYTTDANGKIVLGYGNRSVAGLAYVLGGGLEYALTPDVSIGLGYEHYGLDRFSAPTNLYINNVQQFIRNQPSVDAVRFDVNYHLDGNHLAPWATAAETKPLPGFQFEVGARYWYSVGKFQKDLAANSLSNTSLVSRLTYQDKANSGEIFGKVERDNFYLRGSFADGRLSTAKLNDEDWLGDGQNPTNNIPYSNTLSSGKGTPTSVIADIGYDAINTSTGKLGASLGYTFLYEQHQGYGCTQLTVLPAICGPGQVAPGALVITEADYWNGLRLGISGETMLMDRLKLSADVAYLPYVVFNGTDNHWLRNLVIKEAGHGQGTQAQVVLSYDITPQFSVGAGARYWAMWTDTGTDRFNGAPTYRNVAYSMERAGAFLQASYRFNTQ